MSDLKTKDSPEPKYEISSGFGLGKEIKIADMVCICVSRD